MSREIKFEFLYRGMPYSKENQDRPWFKKVYSLDELTKNPLSKISDVHSFSELVAKRQFTGLTDVNGVEIYEGDILKAYHFTNESGEDEYLYHIIKWSEKFTGWFCLNTESMSDDDGSVQLWVYANGHKNFEIVGNIHQHKHLLEQNK